MTPKQLSVLTQVNRTGGRRQRQRRRRRWALAIAIILVAGAAAAAVVVSREGKKSADATSTTTSWVSAASTTTLLGLTSTSTAVAPANAAGVYTATLSGESEIPPVTTSASGSLTLTVAEGGASVKYVLKVSNLTDATVARLHEGKAGASGETIMTLYGGPPKSGDFSGVLAQGTFTAAELQGPLQGKTVADLETLIKGGRVYLNVGSNTYIYGELRGQVQ